MLVLARQRGESVVIGGGDSGLPEMVVTVVDIRGDKIRFGIDAPKNVPVHRKEVYDAIQRQNAEADAAKAAGEAS